MKHEQWKKVLSAINADKDLSKDNVIDKIKEKLEAEDRNEYEKWNGAGFSVNHTFEVENKKHTLLHLADQNILGSVTNALLKVDGINVNAVEKDGFTPLHLAVLRDHKDVVDALLKAGGINVNAADKNGCTPLHRAALSGHKDVVDALLKAGGINVNAVEKNGCTPLHCAVLSGHKDVEKVLIGNGANPLLRDNAGRTPKDLAKEAKADKLGKCIGYSVAVLGTAVAVVLFATGVVAVELMSIVIAVAAIAIATAALAVGGATYMMLKPSTKMDETKGPQNVNEEAPVR